MSHLNSRVARIVAGLAVVSAFAVAPMAAQADDTNLGGTLSGGALTVVAPDITAFGVTLNGVAQTETTTLGAWSMTDATGTNDGYTVTASATAPTVGAVEADAGTGGSISLMPQTATAAPGNLAAAGPAKIGAVLQPLPETGVGAVTIQNAPATDGQGAWNVAADTGGAESLSVVIPGDVSVLAYAIAPRA